MVCGIVVRVRTSRRSVASHHGFAAIPDPGRRRRDPHQLSRRARGHLGVHSTGSPCGYYHGARPRSWCCACRVCACLRALMSPVSSGNVPHVLGDFFALFAAAKITIRYAVPKPKRKFPCASPSCSAQPPRQTPGGVVVWWSQHVHHAQAADDAGCAVLHDVLLRVQLHQRCEQLRRVPRDKDLVVGLRGTVVDENVAAGIIERGGGERENTRES